MKKQKALITGINGQDGSYLAEFLLKKNYEVHGILRRSSSFNTKRINHLIENKSLNNNSIFFYYGDVIDHTTIFNLIKKIQPNEVYNLAAQSHVKISFELPLYTTQVNGVGVLNILESVRSQKIDAKIYQASTSEMFGNPSSEFQNESTPFKPCSPYAVSKLYAHELVSNYRDSYNMFCCSGILFNHESPRRGETFVTKKISNAVREIKEKKRDQILLGNIHSKRDWGFAPEYVEAMWSMLQNNKPIDYVVATGENYSVKEFIQLAFKEIDIEIEWEGKGLNEIGLNKKNKDVLIKIDEKYFRPSEVNNLKGDSSKIEHDLGWKAKTKIKDLVKLMNINYS